MRFKTRLVKVPPCLCRKECFLLQQNLFVLSYFGLVQPLTAGRFTMTALIIVVALLYFRKEIKGIVGGVKLIGFTMGNGLLSDAKRDLIAQAKASGMKDADKASTEELMAFLSK